MARQILLMPLSALGINRAEVTPSHLTTRPPLPTSRRGVRLWVRAIARTPMRLMLTVWVIALGAFYFGPIHYLKAIRPATWAFLGACLLGFFLGSLVGRTGRTGLGGKKRRALLVSSSPQAFAQRVDLVARRASIAGLVGIACLAFDKLFLSGLDYSKGATAVRFSRAAEVNFSGGGGVSRSPLLYVGYCLFGFSVVAFLLYLLKGDTMRRSTVRLAHITLISPIGYGVLYGGRSPMGLLVGFALAAMVVRVLVNQRALPQGKAYRMALVGMVIASAVYGTYIFRQRSIEIGYSNYADLATLFAGTYEAENSPTLKRLVDTGVVDSAVATDLLLTSYYMTHEMPLLDRTLYYRGRLGPYYGGYQFYLIGVLVGRVVPELSVEQKIIREAYLANTYGFFSTAWGGMLLDFGIVGGILGVYICGWLSGRIYRRALYEGDLRCRLLMCYVIVGIFSSPVLSMFTISISLPILVSLCVTVRFLPRR